MEETSEPSLITRGKKYRITPELKATDQPRRGVGGVILVILGGCAQVYNAGFYGHDSSGDVSSLGIIFNRAKP